VLPGWSASRQVAAGPFKRADGWLFMARTSRWSCVTPTSASCVVCCVVAVFIVGVRHRGCVWGVLSCHSVCVEYASSHLVSVEAVSESAPAAMCPRCLPWSMFWVCVGCVELHQMCRVSFGVCYQWRLVLSQCDTRCVCAFVSLYAVLRCCGITRVSRGVSRPRPVAPQGSARVPLTLHAATAAQPP
jgi:hypothetical protein